MATQPNLPNYQLSKLPDLLLAQQQQFNQAVTTSMQQASANLAKKKAERKALEKEADAVETNFINVFNQQEKSGIIQMDDANRAWATETAAELNDLYMDAYGSKGTAAKRNAYKSKLSLAMDNINIIGTYANIEMNNQKAITTNKASLDGRSKGMGLFVDDSFYGDANTMYQNSLNMKGPVADLKVMPDKNGRPQLTYRKVNSEGKAIGESITVPMAAIVNKFNMDTKDLNYYLVGEDDNIRTYTEGRSQIIKDVAGKGVERIEKRFDKEKNQWVKVKTINYGSYEEMLKKNKPLADQLESDVNTSRFFAKWKQMQGDGSIKDLPGSELAWDTPDDDLLEDVKDLVKDAENPEEAKKIYDTDNDGTITVQEIRAEMRKTAILGMANEYQKLRPINEVEVAVQMFEGKPQTPTGGYKQSQIAEWHSKGNRLKYNNAVKEIDEIIAITDAEKGLNKIAKQLTIKSGKTHATGAQIKEKYGDAAPPFLIEDELYVYKGTEDGVTTEPVMVGFNKEDFENPEVLRQQLYEVYGYDAEDQYYYGDEQGRKFVDTKYKNQITP